VEKRVAATATMTRDPSTMRKIKGADWVNGLGGSEVTAVEAAEEVAEAGLVLVLEVEPEIEVELEGADEDILMLGIVDEAGLVGEILLSLGVAVLVPESVGVASVTAEVGVGVVTWAVTISMTDWVSAGGGVVSTAWVGGACV
jgi:hypothetical protein